MEQIPSSKANSSSASTEIPYILWYLKVHYRVQKSLSFVPVLSQTNPLHSTPPQSYFFKINFNIFLSPTPISLQGLSSSGLPTKICMNASHLPYVPYTMLDVFDKMHINY